jgi:hypothetical protein
MPGPSAPVRHRRYGHSRARPRDSRRRPRARLADGPQADAVAWRNSGSCGRRAIGGTVGRRSAAASGRGIAGEQPSFHSRALQLPDAEPIITATAAATMIVGMSGSGGSSAIRPSRARCDIPARAAAPCRAAGRRWSAPRRPGSRAGCTHHGGSNAQLDGDRARRQDRADDQDQEGRRPVADVEAAKSSPQARHWREATQPANRVRAPQRGQRPAASRPSARARRRACQGRGPARPSRPRRRSR